MLLKIRDFIQEQQWVSASQLQEHFQIEASALEPMLEFLIQRQEIQKVSADVCQKECQACDDLEYYQWLS